MQIRLGEKIRMLRHRDGRTQEALANALGVTSQAVSRWEANGGYPDMETIPAIANYFHVTIDELFGYNSDIEARIQCILDEADREIRRIVGLEQYIGKLKAAAEEYPSNSDIQLRLGTALVILGFNRHGARSSMPNMDGDGENIVSYNRGNMDFVAALTIFEKLLPEITDPDDRKTVIGYMVRLYSIRGEYNKAEALARKQDSLAVCQEVLLPTAATGGKRREYQGKLLLALAWKMANTVISEVTLRNDLRSSHAGIAKVVQMVQLYQNILDDGNYGFGHYALMELYRLCARTAAELDRTEEAGTYARQWYHHHCAYAALKKEGGDFHYTALLVEGVTESIEAMPPIRSWKETIGLQPQKLRALLERITPEIRDTYDFSPG